MPSQNLSSSQAVDQLKNKITVVKLPEDVLEKLNELFAQLEVNIKSEDTFWKNYQSVNNYVDWIISLPWFSSSQDMLDINHAQELLNKEHYGLGSVKERILEYISVLSLQKIRNINNNFHAPILLFVGLVGTGKTTLASSIAKVLGRQFIRIPLGGLGDPYYLRGRSNFYPESEPGQIIKGLTMAKTNNPVILLDEIDRVADDALNTIMGVLVELLDPEQNNRFTDHYIDHPFDLSQAIFCATCNNTNRIATAVMDRLEVIQMPSYTDEEKINIGRDYILPKAIKESGLSPEDLTIGNDVWPSIVRPLGFDAGVRTLKRNIENLCRKVARIILETNKSVNINSENIKQFIPQW